MKEEKDMIKTIYKEESPYIIWNLMLMTLGSPQHRPPAGVFAPPAPIN